MSPELASFLSANGTVVVLVVGGLAALGLVQWRKIRVAEQELEYKQNLLEKGLVPPPERPVARPVRRGLFEQFAALSGGAKAGVIFVVIVALSMVSSTIHGIVFWSNVRQQHAYAAPEPREVVPSPVPDADAISGHAFYLDLQPVANQKLTAAFPGESGPTLATLPQKRQEFRGVPFQVGPNYVRLRGKNEPQLPTEAKNVAVGFKVDKLHILHGTSYGAFGDAAHRFHVPEGTEIGQYRVRYADKSERVIPVVYGEDVRDAWDWDRSRATTRGVVAWTGTTPAATREGVSVRVYLTTWKNPRPDAEVTHIDYASEPSTAASPFCVVLTAECAWK